MAQCIPTNFNWFSAALPIHLSVFGTTMMVMVDAVVFCFLISKAEHMPVLPDRGWNLPSPYLPVWSRKTKTQWLPLSVTSLLRVMPKMYEDERFELVISRRPRLDRLFEISVYKNWQVDRNFEIFKRLTL